MMRPVVRPNRFDSRERRLEDDLRRIIKFVHERHPEDFESPGRLDGLDFRVAILGGENELTQPRYADLDGRVRSPLVRWWRDVRTRNMT